MQNGFVVTERMRNTKIYTGMVPKFGITVEGQCYIVKKEKIPYPEYVASRFIKYFGLPVHDVYLGIYGDQTVCLVKDFTTADLHLKSFNATRQSSLDTALRGKEYTYEDVTHMLELHTKLSPVERTKVLNQFWDMYIFDAILANRDRHAGNWGVLSNERTAFAAPIFDNGASLFPEAAQNSNLAPLDFSFMEQRCGNLHSSVLRVKGVDGKWSRMSYVDIIQQAPYSGLVERLQEFKNRVSFEDIYEAITSVCQEDLIPRRLRLFYVVLAGTRYLHIIQQESLREAFDTVTRRVCSDG